MVCYEAYLQQLTVCLQSGAVKSLFGGLTASLFAEECSYGIIFLIYLADCKNLC